MAEGTGEGTGTGAGTGNQQVEKPAWLAQAPADLRDNELFTGHKTIGDQLKAHLDLFGKVKDLEGIKAKFDALPKAPAKPEDYQFDKIDGVDDALVNSARPGFHKYGLNNDQAKGMIALETELHQARIDQFVAQREKEKAAQETQLKAEWGDKYQERTENMHRFLKTFSQGFKIGDKPADVNGFLESTKLGNDPFFIRFIDALAQKFPEDASPSGRSGDSGGEKTGLISIYKS